MKKVIQRNLPVTQRYKIIGSYYRSIEDGGGHAIDDDTTEDDIRAMHEQMRAAALRAINKAKSAN